MRNKTLKFNLPVIGALTLICLGGGNPVESTQQKETENYQVSNPAFSEGLFPCSDCHADMEPNPQRRELEYMHTDILLRHAEDQRWCLDCHNPQNRDQLRLISGEVVPFAKSYRLCGQCHGNKLRDWKLGIHGKRTGYWNSEKQYQLCVHCHNPHVPGIKPLKPLPPPERPKTAQH